jgi:hypothetical protein
MREQSFGGFEAVSATKALIARLCRAEGKSGMRCDGFIFTISSEGEHLARSYFSHSDYVLA